MNRTRSLYLSLALVLATILAACGGTPASTPASSTTTGGTGASTSAPQASPSTASVAPSQSTETSGGASGGTITFGVPIAQTGALSGLGVPALEGIQFAVKTVNDKGGVKVGDKSYTIKVIARDDASTADTNKAVTEQLITQDKADVLIGGVGTNVVGQGLPIAERYGMPVVTTFAYAPTVLPKSPKYSFVNVMSTTDQYQGPLTFLKARGAKTVKLVTSNDALGEAFAREMPELVKAAGMQVVALERFEPKTTDFTPVTSRLKGVQSDALIVEAQAADSYNFRRAEVQQGICPKYSAYEYGPNLQPDWPKGTGEAKDGALGQTFWWGTMKGGQDRWFGDNQGFVKAYTAAAGKAPAWATAQGVQSVELMVLAIEKAGSLDKNAIAAAMAGLSGSTLYGPIKFDQSHFNRGFINNQLVVQQQGDQAVVIFPELEAKAQFKEQTCGK